MALPSEYSKIDYIEATGTQYFDTGFQPNQSSRVVLDFAPVGTAFGCLFGARTASNASDSKNTFGMWLQNDKAYPHYGDGSYAQKPITIPAETRLTFDMNGATTTINGTSVSFSATTFSAGCNLTLLGMNTVGSVDSRRAVGRLYGVKIYDNGTLVRDFVPCKNTTGALGLWDNINSKFYANAGTGTFTTGSKHKTLIDGTGREIKSGRVLIASTGYDIKKGRTLIDGTGYDISFGTPVGELAVGSSVFMNVKGVRTEFIVVHQGNPDSSLYDASCNGTWVLMKDVYANVNVGIDYYYHTGKTNDYLNNTFLKLLDSGVQTAIKQVKIPYTTWGYTSSYYGNVIHKKENGLSTKIFAPAAGEVSNDFDGAGDGATLDYFANDSANTTRCPNRVAYLNGEARYWKLRTPELLGSGSQVDEISSTCYITENGWLGSSNYIRTYGIRPQLIFPFEVLNDDDFNIIT